MVKTKYGVTIYVRKMTVIDLKYLFTRDSEKTNILNIFYSLHAVDEFLILLHFKVKIQNLLCTRRLFIEQVHNAYPRRRIRGIDTSEPSVNIIFVFTCVFLMAVFQKYLRYFLLSGLDLTTYITKSVFLRGMYRYQIC